MIIDIRKAYSEDPSEIQIYIDKKIAYFATVGKKIRLFDKNSEPLTKKFKKGPLGKTLVCDKDQNKTYKIFPQKDKNKKVYYGIRPQDESRVFRVQTFLKDNVTYLLFTEDKKTVAAAKSFSDGRTLYRLYLKEENQELHRAFLAFVLYYCDL